jgi:hypothetical protein
MAATTADLVRRYITLDRTRKEHEAEVTGLMTALADLERELLPRFESAGLQRMTVDGVTVYIHHQLWAKALGGNMPAAVEALKACELAGMVEERFNSQTLSSYIREKAKEFAAQYEHGAPLAPHEILARLPAPLAAAIEVTEKVNIRTRKGD